MLTKEQVQARIEELKAQIAMRLRDREALGQQAKAWVAQHNEQIQQADAALIALRGQIEAWTEMLKGEEQGEDHPA